MASTVCGNTALATLLSWNATDIGYKTAENVPGCAVVSSVWCKVCAKDIDNVKSDNHIQGKACEQLVIYVMGTNDVTKHNVRRHLSSQVSYKKHFLVSTVVKLDNKELFIIILA